MANIKNGIERRSKTQGFQIKPSILKLFRELSKEVKMSLGDLLELMILNAVKENNKNKDALSRGVDANSDIILSPRNNNIIVSHKNQVVGGQNNETK